MNKYLCFQNVVFLFRITLRDRICESVVGFEFGTGKNDLEQHERSLIKDRR